MSRFELFALPRRTARRRSSPHRQGGGPLHRRIFDAPGGAPGRQRGRGPDHGLSRKIWQKLTILYADGLGCPLRGGPDRRPPGRRKRLSAHRKYGIAKALSAAPAPKAARKPSCWAIQPTAIEPVPMPVSKAARMPPKAEPRREGSTNFSTWPTKAGYWLPKPRPKTAAAEHELQPRVGEGGGGEADGDEGEAGQQEAPVADPVGEPAGEEARDEHREGEGGEEDAARRDAVAGPRHHRHEARDPAVAEGAEEERHRDADHAPLDEVSRRRSGRG